jgi:hypothetical protein
MPRKDGDESLGRQRGVGQVGVRLGIANDAEIDFAADQSGDDLRRLAFV